jgi:hypothetical protein
MTRTARTRRARRSARRSGPRLARLAALLVAAVAGATATAAPAGAAPPTDGWSCRAQSLDVNSGPLGVVLDPILDPIEGLLRTGEDGTQCVTNGATPLGGALAQVTTQLAPLGIDLGALSATTTIDATKVPRLQAPASTSRVAGLRISVAGAELVSVSALEARASATCAAGAAQYASSYDIGDVAVFGQSVDLTGPVQTITDPLMPLGPIVRLTPGHEVKTADGVARTALRVEVLEGITPVEVKLLDVSLAIASVNDHGTPCAIPAPPTVGVPSTTSARSLTAAVTPPAGRTIARCSFALTPLSGGGARTIAGTWANGACTASVPRDVAPGTYRTTVNAVTDGADPGEATSAPADLRIGYPGLGEVTLSGRNVGATLVLAQGTTLTSCTITVTPAGGSPVALPGKVADGRCSVDLPRAQYPPGTYDVTIDAVASDGSTDRVSKQIVLTGPQVGDPVAIGPLVVFPVAPGSGATITECTATAAPVGGTPRSVQTYIDPGTSSCTAGLPPEQFPPGEYDVEVTIKDSNGDVTTSRKRVTIVALGGAGGSGGANGGGGTGATGGKTQGQVAAERLICEKRRLSILDVRRSTSGVRVTGVAESALVGKRVSIRIARRGASTRQAGTATVRKDGTFSATVPAPAKRYLATSFALRYSATSGSASSRSVRLTRRTNITSSSLTSGKIKIAGRVSAPYPRRGTAVRVRIQTGCTSYRTVATVDTTRTGRFTAIFDPPADGSAAFYRVETRVPSRKGGPSRSRSFSLDRLVAGR